MEKYFNSEVLKASLKKIGKLVLYLLLVIIVAAFIGCAFSGTNPFAIFFPTTCAKLFNFLS